MNIAREHWVTLKRLFEENIDRFLQYYVDLMLDEGIMYYGRHNLYAPTGYTEFHLERMDCVGESSVLIEKMPEHYNNNFFVYKNYFMHLHAVPAQDTYLIYPMLEVYELSKKLRNLDYEH